MGANSFTLAVPLPRTALEKRRLSILSISRRRAEQAAEPHASPNATGQPINLMPRCCSSYAHPSHVRIHLDEPSSCTRRKGLAWKTGEAPHMRSSCLLALMALSSCAISCASVSALYQPEVCCAAVCNVAHAFTYTHRRCSCSGCRLANGVH